MALTMARHPHESEDPCSDKLWIPAFAGTTFPSRLRGNGVSCYFRVSQRHSVRIVIYEVVGLAVMCGHRLSRGCTIIALRPVQRSGTSRP